MNDFKEQYNQELIHQEIKSNKYTLKGFLWFIACVALLWLLTMVGFFEVDKKLITISFVVSVILFLSPLYIYLRGDLAKPWIKYFLLTLICVDAGVIATFLSYHAVFAYVLPLLFAIQYRRQSTIWFVYLVNTVTMLISSIASFFYGICDLNLLLQSQHVRNYYLDIITEDALNIPFNANPVFVIIVFEVLPRSIILLIFSVIMQYAIVNSNEDAYRIAQLTYLKETDTRTRVFNKNKYEEMTTEYYPKVSLIAVLFFDLNNLKMINDKYGHAMGDWAIGTLSSVLNSFSSQKCRVYRIGGDEFLMILDDPLQDEAENRIKQVKEKLQAANAANAAKNVNPEVRVSSAVGLAYGKGTDILQVVAEADASMYENKKRSKEGRK